MGFSLYLAKRVQDPIDIRPCSFTLSWRLICHQGRVSWLWKWWIVFAVGWPTRDVRPVEMFQLGPLSEILTIANLWFVASRIWTYTEPELRFCRIKLCSSDNHYTTVPLSTSKSGLRTFLSRYVWEVFLDLNRFSVVCQRNNGIFSEFSSNSLSS